MLGSVPIGTCEKIKYVKGLTFGRVQLVTCTAFKCIKDWFKASPFLLQPLKGSSNVSFFHLKRKCSRVCAKTNIGGKLINGKGKTNTQLAGIPPAKYIFL